MVTVALVALVLSAYVVAAYPYVVMDSDLTGEPPGDAQLPRALRAAAALHHDPAWRLRLTAAADACERGMDRALAKRAWTIAGTAAMAARTEAARAAAERAAERARDVSDAMYAAGWL